MINPSLAVIKLSNLDLIKRMGVLLVLEVGIMIAFMLTAPLYYQVDSPHQISRQTTRPPGPAADRSIV